MLTEKNSQEENAWTSWRTPNKDGHKYDPIVCPDTTYVTAMKWRQKNFHGLIDVEIECNDGTKLRATKNDNGDWDNKMTGENKHCDHKNWFFSIGVNYEKRNFWNLNSFEGIVNARNDCGELSNWNQNGKWMELNCKNKKIVGLQVIAKVGAGIMNLRIKCD